MAGHFMMTSRPYHVTDSGALSHSGSGAFALAPAFNLKSRQPIFAMPSFGCYVPAFPIIGSGSNGQ